MQKLEFVKAVLREDLGRGDLFARVMPSSPAKAYILAKSDGVLAGREYVQALATLYELQLQWNKTDGESFQKGEKLLELQSDSHTLMAVERTLLNILLHASSIATLTHKYVQKLAEYDTLLLDTRKTRPGLREFEKYATRMGGGVNHRMGLDDSLMLKDTHLKTIHDLEAFIKQARKQIPFTAKIEVECEDLAQVQNAFAAGADVVMCDNMSIEQMQAAVALRNEHYPKVLLEASGNVTLDRLEEIAQTGIDAISTGATVHQANWIDLSMKVE